MFSTTSKCTSLCYPNILTCIKPPLLFVTNKVSLKEGSSWQKWDIKLVACLFLELKTVQYGEYCLVGKGSSMGMTWQWHNDMGGFEWILKFDSFCHFFFKYHLQRTDSDKRFMFETIIQANSVKIIKICGMKMQLFWLLYISVLNGQSLPLGVSDSHNHLCII